MFRGLMPFRLRGCLKDSVGNLSRAVIGRDIPVLNIIAILFKRPRPLAADDEPDSAVVTIGLLVDLPRRHDIYIAGDNIKLAVGLQLGGAFFGWIIINSAKAFDMLAAIEDSIEGPARAMVMYVGH